MAEKPRIRVVFMSARTAGWLLINFFLSAESREWFPARNKRTGVFDRLLRDTGRRVIEWTDFTRTDYRAVYEEKHLVIIPDPELELRGSIGKFHYDLTPPVYGTNSF